MTLYLLGYFLIFYIAILRFFSLRQDLPLTLFLYIFVGIIGGIRFETGMDWPQYVDYFDSISVDQDPYSSYKNNNYKLAFEFGYFLLNYVTKYLGGGIEIIFLTTSIFCAISTYLLSSFFSGNRIFIFTIYLSYNFIYMHFSTIRQSLAVGLFFLGLWAYLKFSNRILTCILFVLSACFQISALLYTSIFLISFLFRSTFKNIIIWVTGILLLSIAIHFGSDLYSLLSTILPPSFASKLMEYATWDNSASIKTYIFGFYIFCCALSLGWLEKNEQYPDYKLPKAKEYKFTLNLATTALMLSVAFIVLFPNNFALWTRTFNIASVLFACSLSTFYYSLPARYKMLYFIHLIVAAVSFIVSMYAAADAMIPYKTIL